VPPQLKHVRLHMLDVGLLQAGASMKGEFEQRLRSVIDEVQASAKPIILFIDETHTLVGAGGAAGTGDAANLLKPALARGTLRTVGATTFAEYKKHIEKDPALTRRFQTVQVDEPDEVRAVLMMRGVAATMEKHHKVQILDDALEAAVKLSHRYIPARQLPDKSVSLIDTACARVAVSLHATPAEVDDSARRIEALETEQGIIAREAAIGIETADRSTLVEEQLTTERARLETLTARWASEKTLVDKLLGLRAKLRGVAGTVEGTGSLEKPSAVQQAFLDHFAFQCGYCTPGFVMATEMLLGRLRAQPVKRDRLDAVIEDAVGQHICRCTGYARYHQAIRAVVLAEKGLVTA